MKLRKLCTVLLVVGVSALYLPAANAGAVVTWKLTSSDIPSQYLPSSVSSTASGTSNTGSSDNTGSGGNAGSGGNVLTDIGGAASCISSDISFTRQCTSDLKYGMLPPGTVYVYADAFAVAGQEEYCAGVTVQNSTTGSFAEIVSAGAAASNMFATLFPNGDAHPSGNSVICARPPNAVDNDYSACPSGSYATVMDANGNPDKLVLVP